MNIEKNNIIAGKMAYARGKRPAVDCILCGVVREDPLVDNLAVYHHENFFITLNLYPYNPGHLMIVPNAHYEDVREMSEPEALELHRLQVLTLEVLDSTYRPAGYNIGYNLGASSGASIPHIHLQVVPRYRTELGFFDILSDSRVIVEEPQVTQTRLRKAFEAKALGFFSQD